MKKNFVFKQTLFAVLFICSCREYEMWDGPDSSPYWTEWTNSELISIVDDSLAVLAIYKYKKELGIYNGKITTDYRAGLFLVNYRNKQKPLLGDTLELEDSLQYRLSIPSGYFKDSSVLVLEHENSKFGFWKIGEKSIKFNSLYGVDMGHFPIGISASPWINNNILLRSQILNPETGQMERFELSEEYKWMSQNGRENNDEYNFERGKNYCIDEGFLSYIDDKIVCVKKNYFNHSAELIVDGVVADTHLPFTWNKWLGSYINSDNMSADGVITGGVIKIDTKNFKFDKDFSLWVYKLGIDKDAIRFYNDRNNNPDDFVRYSAEDLINFKGEQP